ncbi:SurA N-terminal domain-containing protein, partial [bacterium]|nr:SurA N-terminal domain-containing protein [bacterium]MBU1025508.1 SurA N-terminal domain-containing protein [bacterium]
MISSKKVIRDIIAIVLIAVAGVWVYKSYVAPRAEQNNHKADSHSEEQGNMEGDGSRFELDNHEDALSIDGKVYSMSDVDNKAQHFVAMMGGNPGALTKDVLARARSEAVRTLHVEAAMTKGAKELGIEISEEDVNEAIAKIVEEQGGEENYKKFLSQFNVSEEAMERRMRKD